MAEYMYEQITAQRYMKLLESDYFNKFIGVFKKLK